MAAMTNQPGTVSKRAAGRIPAHVPGQVITINLMDLPLYLEIRGLQAMDLGEVAKREQQLNTRKTPGVVWVQQVNSSTNGSK